MSSGFKALTAPFACLCFLSRIPARKLFRGIALSVLLLALFPLQPRVSALQQVQERGELIVTGISGPTTFYQTSAGARGLQYELARLFAEELGVKLVLQDASGAQQVLDDIRANHTDIAITGLASDDSRLSRLRTASPYMTVSEQLVQRLDRPLPANFDHIGAARIGVIASSSEAQRLKALARRRSDIQLIEFDNADPLTLLQRVDNGDLDYAAMDSNEFDARRTLFPDIGVSLNLQDNNKLAWAFPRTQDRSLYNAAQDFLARKRADGSLDRLVAFYSQGNTFATASIRSFQHDVAQRLPRYQPLFEKSAQAHHLDWRLLAAIAYQESRWQPGVVSPTGVEGIMMLTAVTAAHMGVVDRASVPQSIQGGAAYYRLILNTFPTVQEPDRTWMALAAYNMGPAYIERARLAAFKAGDDGNKWLTVSQRLSAMAEEARRHGRRSPVTQALAYVQQVRRYYDALLLASSTASNDQRVAVAGIP